MNTKTKQMLKLTPRRTDTSLNVSFMTATRVSPFKLSERNSWLNLIPSWIINYMKSRKHT